MGPSLSTRKSLTQEEAEREALTINIFRRYSLLEEERLVIKTMAYSDNYKKILDGIFLDKMKLYGEMKKEKEEAITKIKGEALIEKEDPGAFVIPIRPEGKINLNALADTGSDINVMPYHVYMEIGREELKNVNRGITMLSHSKAEPMRLLKYVLCKAVLNPFRKVYVWKKVVSFLGSLLVPLQHVDWKPNYTGCINKNEEGDGQWHAKIRLTDPYGNIYDQGFVTKKTSRSYKTYMTMGSHDDEAGSSRSKHSRQHETVEEAMPLRVHHPYLLWEGCNQAARSRYNTRLGQLLLRLIYSVCVLDWNVLNQMGCGEEIDEMLTIKLFMADTNEEIFTSEARTNAFNIDERIYSELCHEFYSTYKFDDVCAAAELKTKKIIKFRLCGHAFSWTLLKFAKRLGLYNSEEIKDEGFDVYFQGGLCSDEHFNAQEYWLSISREENLSLSRSHASTIRNPGLMVLHKMITYGLCQRTTGIAKRKNFLSEEVLNSLGAPIYCRALDTTTLREDMYAGVFEHMAGVYSVPLQGAYNPPGYDQKQYNQYYQQCLPQQQQQPDDDE
ncbi:hypothetical protein Tco_0461284 [Tanacetum coccineum]